MVTSIFHVQDEVLGVGAFGRVVAATCESSPAPPLALKVIDKAHPGLQDAKALHRARAHDEGAIDRVDVAGHQLRGVGIGAGDEHGGHAHDVRGEPSGDQGAHELAGGHQDLAAEEQRLLASLEACQKQQQQAYVQLEGVVGRPSTAS